MEAIEQDVDSATFKLLKDMLIQENVVDVERYIMEELQQKPDMIAKNVRALCAAVGEDGYLLDFCDRFYNHMEQDAQSLEDMHCITKDSVRARGQDDDAVEKEDSKYKFPLLPPKYFFKIGSWFLNY